VDSEPIRPAEPVTKTVLIPLAPYA
jgi:hypothetical protein